jgi:hypothetical protein
MGNRTDDSKKRRPAFQGVYTIPYLLHAYDVSESSFKRKRIEIKEGKICRPAAAKAHHHRGTSVINNSLQSSGRYNARFVWVRHKLLIGEPPEDNYTGSWDHHMARQKYWGPVYDERVSQIRFGKRKRRISYIIVWPANTWHGSHQLRRTY